MSSSLLNVFIRQYLKTFEVAGVILRMARAAGFFR
jgi:hypothetical protein